MTNKVVNTLALCGALLVCLAGTTRAQETALPAKPPGVLRIGIVKPKVLLGSNEASQLADSVRNVLAEYLQGPTLQVALLSARIASQYSVEARQAECDFVLTTALTHRRGNQGSNVGSTLGRIVGNAPYIPGVDYTEGAIVTSVLNTATGIAASVKARDEMALDFQLLAIGSTKPLLERKEKRRAKTDGEDLLTPLAEAAADAVGTAISK